LLPQLAQAEQKKTSNTDHDGSNHLPSSKKRILQPRIIGGTDAEQGQYPYMVSVVANSGTHDCGGVLVAKDVVLTAAHCSYVPFFVFWIVFGLFDVVLDFHQLTNLSVGLMFLQWEFGTSSCGKMESTISISGRSI
jgi:hypothetical protein